MPVTWRITMERSPFIFAHDPTNFHGGDARAEPGTMPVQNRVLCPRRTGYHVGLFGLRVDGNENNICLGWEI
jgi:hypothetical protein